MKKLIIFSLVFCASPLMAGFKTDALTITGSTISIGGVTYPPFGGSGGAAIYPATATASFPFSLSASSVTIQTQGMALQGPLNLYDPVTAGPWLRFDPTTSGSSILDAGSNDGSIVRYRALNGNSGTDKVIWQLLSTSGNTPNYQLSVSSDMTQASPQPVIRMQIYGNERFAVLDHRGTEVFDVYKGSAAIRMASGQTYNPLEIKDSAGALIFNVDSVGAIKLGSYNGFTLVDSRGVAGGNGGMVFINAANQIAWAPMSTGHGMQIERDSAYNWTSVALAAYQVPDTGMVRPAAKVISATDGTTANAGWFTDAGIKRVSTQFDKTSDTTLANVTGLSVTVQAGRTYTFNCTLFTASNVGGGVQAAIGGTATATAIIYEGETTAGAAIGAQGRATALGSSVGAVTTVTAARIDIAGTITVNAAGTLTVQFAQNTSNGTASSVLVGSYFIVRDNP